LTQGGTARLGEMLSGFLLVLVMACSTAASEIPYRPRLQGVENASLETRLKGVADTFLLEDRPPAGAGLLRRRAEKDISRMIEALRSEGYYGAGVTLEMNEEVSPVDVRFQVDTGPLFRIQAVEISFESGASPFSGEKPSTAGDPILKPGDPARADDMVRAGDRVIERLKNQGHPFAEIKDLKARVDHAERAVRVVMVVIAGPYVRFGGTSVTGLETVDASYVQSKLAWVEGEPFNASLLERTRERLLRTGLFASMDLALDEALDERGHVPVRIHLQERKHRTVGVGVRFQTDEGPGLQADWRHRNFFGKEEALSLSATLSQDLVGMESVFRKPDFLHRDQSLLLEANAYMETPDAYSSRRVHALAGLERRLSDRLTLGGGIGLTASRVDERGREEDYALISLPMRLDWDSSDDFFNPTRGTRAALRLTPFSGMRNEDLRFVRGYASLSHYLPLIREPSLVLATRGALGSITGASRDRVPADERFYAGGGGSVRGVPYQTAGPLEGSKPLGGCSLLEVSAELRLRLNRSVEVVAFVDGGRAYVDSLPNSTEEMNWGIGTGIRYSTFLGPIRLDVAVPVDRRDGVDKAFQIYVSIGQAF